MLPILNQVKPLFTHLSSEQIEKAVHQFKEDGYVILENSIPKPFLRELYTQHMKDLDEKVKRFKMDPAGEGNNGLNRWNMHLPSNETYINPEILTNPRVLPVLKKLVGDDLMAFLLVSDTPFPGSSFQGMHQDLSRFGITVNIPLVDFRDDNSPMQVWPKTHRKPKWKGMETFDYSDLRPFSYEKVLHSKKELKIISETFPSRRVQMPAGSILIRDQRMLHRGTANASQERRPCLAIWYKSARSNIKQLSIPAPHLCMTNFVAQMAFEMRQKGRGPAVGANRKLLTLGNFLGRLADELSKEPPAKLQ